MLLIRDDTSMKSALRRVRGEGNPKCDDSTDKFRDWDSDRGLSKKLPKTCGYHKSIPNANSKSVFEFFLRELP